MDFMRLALDLARQGVGRSSPNPAVGAVLVRSSEIVGRGFHTYAGRKHAEVLALEEAGDRACGATLFVSLEPCCHTGRTGPCTDEIVRAGVARVVAAMQDPNPRVSGKGLLQLRAAGLEVETAGQYTREAEKLNEPFVHFMRTGLPLVTLKAALTLDGKIAAPDDNRGWITSEQARTHVQHLRHNADAILTGIGTVLADDCLLTDRTGLERSRPLLRVVVDSQLRIPLHSRMIESCEGHPPNLAIATTSAAPVQRRLALEARGVAVWILDGAHGRVDLRRLVERLAQEQYQSLMIEGGSKVNWAVLESGLADKIFFYYAPKILGGLESLPVAGGAGRRSRTDALILRNLTLHEVGPDEFAVEAFVRT